MSNAKSALVDLLVSVYAFTAQEHSFMSLKLSMQEIIYYPQQWNGPALVSYVSRSKHLTTCKPAHKCNKTM